MRNRKDISLGLMVLAAILMAIGGLADMCGEKRVLGLSKHHYWADGTFLLVFSSWLVLWDRGEP